MRLFIQKNWPSLFCFFLGLAVIAFAGPWSEASRRIPKSVTVTPTVSAASAYTAGDAVGGLMTFAGATNSQKAAVLTTVTIVDEGDQGSGLVFLCMNATFTPTADNAAISISDADAIKTVVQFNVTSSNYIDIGGSKVAVVGGINQQFTTTGTSLFCQMAALDTPTYAATDDLRITLTFEQY